jgi:hypothetical protein
LGGVREVLVKRAAVSLLAVVCLIVTAPPTVIGAEKKPKLDFCEDGDALVVTTTVEVANVPYLLWTHAVIDRKEIMMGFPVGVVGRLGKPEVHLYYHVFQTRDDPLLWKGGRERTQKIKVSWRLEGHKRGEETYTLRNEFIPSAKELKELAPRLRKLAEETEKRLRSGEFAP